MDRTTKSSSSAERATETGFRPVDVPRAPAAGAAHAPTDRQDEMRRQRDEARRMRVEEVRRLAAELDRRPGAIAGEDARLGGRVARPGGPAGRPAAPVAGDSTREVAALRERLARAERELDAERQKVHDLYQENNALRDELHASESLLAGQRRRA